MAASESEEEDDTLSEVAIEDLVKDENDIGTAFAASLGSNDAMYVSIIQQLIARIEVLENN